MSEGALEAERSARTDFDRLFEDRDQFAIGGLEVEVLHVPGHTPAYVAYRIGDMGNCIGRADARMRGRLTLNGRSTSENASIAALAQRLTRDAHWEATALTVCEHVHGLLKAQTVVFREVAGTLAPAAADGATSR